MPVFGDETQYKLTDNTGARTEIHIKDSGKVEARGEQTELADNVEKGEKVRPQSARPEAQSNIRQQAYQTIDASALTAEEKNELKQRVDAYNFAEAKEKPEDMVENIKNTVEQKEKQQRMEQTITIQDNNLRSIQDSLLIESDDGKYDGITVKIEELIEQIKNQGILIDNQQQIIANLQTTVDELKEQNAENGDEYILYTVKSGDSLGKICSSLGVDYWKNRDLILNLNNIKDENIIIVGQVLFFPKSIQNQ